MAGLTGLGGAGAATAAQLRQRRGWYFYGWASHVFPTIVVTVFMGRYLTSLAGNAVGKTGRVSVFGIPVAPGSLFPHVVSFSTVLLLVAMPVVGAIADRTGAKREILLGFGWLGAASCVAMFAVRGGCRCAPRSPRPATPHRSGSEFKGDDGPTRDVGRPSGPDM